MSKAQRYQAAGRHWQTPSGLVTGPFPGAKTVKDVGRIIRRNAGKAARWHQLDQLHRYPPLVQAQTQTWLGRLRKSCLGKEYKRLMSSRLTPEQLANLHDRVKIKPRPVREIKASRPAYSSALGRSSATRRIHRVGCTWGDRDSVTRENYW